LQLYYCKITTFSYVSAADCCRTPSHTQIGQAFQPFPTETLDIETQRDPASFRTEGQWNSVQDFIFKCVSHEN